MAEVNMRELHRESGARVAQIVRLRAGGAVA
jgi:hypothetical protein